VLERQTLVSFIVGLSIINGIFSPYLNVAIPVAAGLLPELFPRTIEWVLFWSSMLVASATLLVSGIPAALYERFVQPPADADAPAWIWLGTAAFLTLPALLRVF
jgi:hypothetical protein